MEAPRQRHSQHTHRTPTTAPTAQIKAAAAALAYSRRWKWLMASIFRCNGVSLWRGSAKRLAAQPQLTIQPRCLNNPFDKGNNDVRVGGGKHRQSLDLHITISCFYRYIRCKDIDSCLI